MRVPLPVLSGSEHDARPQRDGTEQEEARARARGGHRALEGALQGPHRRRRAQEGGGARHPAQAPRDPAAAARPHQAAQGRPLRAPLAAHVRGLPRQPRRHVGRPLAAGRGARGGGGAPAGGALPHGRAVRHEDAHDVSGPASADRQDRALPARHGASSRFPDTVGAHVP
uniref:Uncharacterized protein n=1 Tax=Arundo donax TaxID=35708 RepID=A0A0A9GV37_ARUDO